MYQIDKSGIYKIVNLINGKIYVGLTKNLKKRKTQHFSSLRNNKHKNCYLQNAFNKYGEKSFDFIVIEECSEEILYEKEHFHCLKLKSYDRKIGYNIRDTSPIGKPKMSKETKLKLSLAHKGKKASPETLQKLRIAQTGMKRGKYSNEHKKKISNAILKSDRTKLTAIQIAKRKKVSQYDLDNNIIKNWNSAQEIRDTLGFDYSVIISCCLNLCQIYNGFRWGYTGNNKPLPLRPSLKKKIIQYTKQKEFLKVWDSISDAAKNLNMRASDISSCLIFKQKSAKGFIWEYY